MNRYYVGKIENGKRAILANVRIPTLNGNLVYFENLKDAKEFANRVASRMQTCYAAVVNHNTLKVVYATAK